VHSENVFRVVVKLGVREFPHNIRKVNVGGSVKSEGCFPPLLLFKGDSVADFPFQTGNENRAIVEVFSRLFDATL
jgi:hypothetical protein